MLTRQHRYATSTSWSLFKRS